MSVIENVQVAIEEAKVNGTPEIKEAKEPVQRDNGKRIRAFQFTLNNYTLQETLDIKKCFEEECVWGIFGYEVSESGTPHLQGACYRTNPINIIGFKNHIGKRCHIEKMIETSSWNRVYCLKGSQSKAEWKKHGDQGPNYGKDANAFEYGDVEDCPKGEQGKRNDIHASKQMVKEGKGMRQIIEFTNSYQAMRCSELMYKYLEKPRDFMPLVMWFWGATGVGKTKMAYDICEMYGYKDDVWKSSKDLKWFEGYDAHQAVIIDELRLGSCEYSMLLSLLDRYEFRIEYKGGSRQFLAKLIIVTCPVGPRELYGQNVNGYCAQSDISQLMRRINWVVEVKKVGTVWPWEVVEEKKE